MKILKKIILYLFLLIAMIFGGIIILKIFDFILNLQFDNIWYSGFKVGFVAWVGILINEYYHFLKDRKSSK